MPPADISRIIHLIERGYTSFWPSGTWKKKRKKKTSRMENAYSCTYFFLRRFMTGKNLNDTGNPTLCWKQHRTTDLMRNIPTCTSVCRLFQISKRKWIGITNDTWGTYLGNQIPQSSPGRLLLSQDTYLKASVVFEVPFLQPQQQSWKKGTVYRKSYLCQHNIIYSKCVWFSS